MAAIRVDGITKTYDDLTAVADVSFEVADGEFFAVVGPSGCGKSTTLRIIAGFEDPDRGTVAIADEDVTDLPPEERAVGYVFQNYALFPHMTASENVAFGLKMHDYPAKDRESLVAETLDLVDLEGFADSYPQELSGGQQQRVALARALVLDPEVLLLDEPLSDLDKDLRESLQFELRRLQEETQVTTIHVTHNQEEAMVLGDRICVLNNGSIEQIGTPRDIYNNPATRFVSEFVGIANAFDATTEMTDGTTVAVLQDFQEVRFPLPSESMNGGDTEGRLVIRPERLQILTAGDPPARNEEVSGTYSAEVIDKQFMGDTTRYELRLIPGGDRGPTIVCHDVDRFGVGEMVRVRIEPDELIFLPEGVTKE